jgi:DNA helicase-2/ATP-dependent DNA helicase PcrA
VEQPREAKPAAPASAAPVNKPRPPVNLRGTGRKPFGIATGAVIKHPVYGRGIVVRREGDGEDAKLTISFPGYGLKKIVEKYAGIKIEE